MPRVKHVLRACMPATHQIFCVESLDEGHTTLLATKGSYRDGFVSETIERLWYWAFATIGRVLVLTFALELARAANDTLPSSHVTC